MSKETDRLDAIFSLERKFPNINSAFSEYRDVDIKNNETVVFLDTNVLLLPYVTEQLGKKDIKEIKALFLSLKEENKIYIAERTAREFIKNRDTKIADLLQSLNITKSKIKPPELNFSKLFQDMEQFEELEKLSSDINEKIRTYSKIYSQIVNQIKLWKGDDPITLIYKDIFDNNNIIPFPLSEDEAITEWDQRLKTKTPPGYQDEKKDDTGIGDFLIWKTLMSFSLKHKKDIVFITGDQKNDWFTRGNNEAIFIRSELIDEFRRTTDNRSIKIIRFDELLLTYKLSGNIVNEVKRAESLLSNENTIVGWANKHKPTRLKFDYSTNDGEVTINDKNLSFTLSFTKASDESIHIYNGNGKYKIARVKDSKSYKELDFKDYDSSSRSYTIKTGEVFLYQNSKGDILVARIINIKDDSRNGEDQDCVEFDYTIYPEGQNVLAP